MGKDTEDSFRQSGGNVGAHTICAESLKLDRWYVATNEFLRASWPCGKNLEDTREVFCDEWR